MDSLNREGKTDVAQPTSSDSLNRSIPPERDAGRLSHDVIGKPCEMPPLSEHPLSKRILPPADSCGNESRPEMGDRGTIQDEKKCVRNPQGNEGQKLNNADEELKVPAKAVNSHDTSNERKSESQSMQPTVQDNESQWVVETLIELRNTTPSISTGTASSAIADSAKCASVGMKRKGGENKRPRKKSASGCPTGAVTAQDSNAKSTAAAAASSNAAVSKEHSQRGNARSEAAWNQRLVELQEFKQLHGHTTVPQKYEKNPSLGAWVARNRLFMRQWEEDPSSCSAYQAERMQVLKDVGLVSGIGKGGFGRTTGTFLSSRSARDWDNQFQSLQEYKATYGNCDVPVKSETHRSLGRWISAQRRKYQQYFSKNTTGNKPSNDLLERFQRLKDIGFNFSIGSGNAKRERSIQPTTERNSNPLPDPVSSKDNEPDEDDSSIKVVGV